MNAEQQRLLESSLIFNEGIMMKPEDISKLNKAIDGVISKFSGLKKNYDVKEKQASKVRKSSNVVFSLRKGETATAQAKALFSKLKSIPHAGIKLSFFASFTDDDKTFAQVTVSASKSSDETGSVVGIYQTNNRKMVELKESAELVELSESMDSLFH